MKRIQLIVNADDFARSPGINDGILKAHKEGIVSTTTAMMNLELAQASLIRASAKAPDLGFGVHLNITYGIPISSPDQVPSLLNEMGAFRDFHELIATPEVIEIKHVEYEWRNQIEAFLETDIPLDHLDSHHHTAVFNEALFELYLDLAAEYGCGVRAPYPMDIDHVDLPSLYNQRVSEFILGEAPIMMHSKEVPHPDGFMASFFAKEATVEHLTDLLKMLKPGVYELMCHPGYYEAELEKSSSYARYREHELEILTHQATLDLIEEADIQLQTYRTACLTR